MNFRRVSTEKEGYIAQKTFKVKLKQKWFTKLAFLWRFTPCNSSR